MFPISFYTYHKFSNMTNLPATVIGVILWWKYKQIDKKKKEDSDNDMIIQEFSANTF